jgi:hypothetical protein
MAENVTLEFLGAQMERTFAEQAKTREDIGSLREDIRVLTAIVLRHDASLSAIIEQLHGMTAQFNRFNDRLRRLEDQPAE